MEQLQLTPCDPSPCVTDLLQDLEAVEPLGTSHCQAFLGLLFVSFDNVSGPIPTGKRSTSAELGRLLHCEVLCRRTAPFLELLIEVLHCFPGVPLHPSLPQRPVQSVHRVPGGLPDVTILRLTCPAQERDELTCVRHCNRPSILSEGSELGQQVMSDTEEIDAASVGLARRSTEKSSAKVVAHHYPLTLVEILVPIASNDKRTRMLQQEAVERADESKRLVHRYADGQVNRHKEGRRVYTALQYYRVHSTAQDA
eukprot:5214766-Amphidinium_carterae.1